jgi:small subunit ribosomal protein S3
MIERTFIKQGLRKIELNDFLHGELEKAGFTGTEIIKTPLVTRIVVNVSRPGLAIGKSGQNIKMLTETIEQKFGIDNPQLEIKEIEKPNLDAKAVANKLKALIERGFSWRSVLYRTIRDIMAEKAQGVEIILSGKLSGKGGRKRKVRVSEGYMKKVGEQSKLVDYAQVAVYPKAGAIGIKVKIVKPDTVFPDKIDLKKELQHETESAEEGKESKEEKVSEKSSKKEEKESAKKEKHSEEKTETKKEEKKKNTEETKTVKNSSVEKEEKKEKETAVEHKDIKEKMQKTGEKEGKEAEKNGKQTGKKEEKAGTKKEAEKEKTEETKTKKKEDKKK